MHKARALANAYLWNKGNRKFYPERRFKIYVPKEWALEIIDEDEWNMLKELEAYTDEDAKYATEFYRDPEAKWMPDAHHFVRYDGLVGVDYTNKAVYAYSDIVDFDKHMKDEDIDNIKENPLFPVVLSVKANVVLEYKGLTTADVDKMSEEELDSLGHKSLVAEVPQDYLIRDTRFMLNVLGTQDRFCADVSEKVTGCATCDNDY